MTVIDVLLLDVTEAAVPPNVTDIGFARLLPPIVTLSPPFDPPAFGVIDVIDGVGGSWIARTRPP